MGILVFGSSGQVGRSIVDVATRRGYKVKGLTRSDVDIMLPASISESIANYKPGLIVNAAAYTAVDAAETQRQTCYSTNVTGAAILAAKAAEVGVPYIHFSSDYVFSGSKREPYIETDDTEPLNFYGRTKERSERYVRMLAPKHVIIRTSWVYGALGKNFLTRILELSNYQNNIAVVDDQWGCPTATIDLALGVLHVFDAIKKGDCIWGTYHLASAKPTTWNHFAKFIMASAELDVNVSGIDSATLLSPAKRPPNSALRSDLFFETFGYRPECWEYRVREILKDIRSNQGGASGISQQIT